MKKQLLRVKQIADQTFLRAEKTEVLTEDLLAAEKRVDSIKLSCHLTQKKITSCQIDFGSETSLEKRLKKIPQVSLGLSMSESGATFSKASVLGDVLKECASIQTKLGAEHLEYCDEVEKLVLKPLSGILENEVHNVNKLRKQLGKLVLDMDSARTRFQTAERHSLQATCNTNLNVVGKVDTLKEELEDASQKVEQCRDTLAAEMFALISREPQLARLLLQYQQLQATYHRNALSMLESTFPSLQNLIDDFPQKPVYGCSLEEHLRVTNREIAQVLENCILFLVDYGLVEEGLLRIAGSSTKLRKIKSAFDAGVEIDFSEFIRDPHAVSGALKSYLRELPEPLMTFSLYNEWLNAIKLQDLDAKLQALWQVLHKLPEVNFKNLRYVIQFLSKVHENMETNKMSSQNLAIVMAPNLIWSPSDESATLGMNMSIASLHTSIVDTLIIYSRWFFSDGTEQVNPQDSEKLKTECDITKLDTSSISSEVNGNNLQVVNSMQNPTSCPHSPLRGVRKTAAPPPPVKKSLNDDLNPARESLAATNIALVDVDCGNTKATKAAPETNLVKSEKPAVPDKPDYSSLSLDRKSLRHGTTSSRSDAHHRTSEIMVRSHIERPTVPPPERPVKPQKFCSSSESIFSAADERSKSKKDSELGSSSVAEQPEIGPPLQHSKSFSKGNRFDFLVNQKDDKPPERPPRSLDGSVKSEAGNNTQGICDLSSASSSTKIDELEKIKPAEPEKIKPSEPEKIKPARPLPPSLPAKPKFNLQNENTNL